MKISIQKTSKKVGNEEKKSTLLEKEKENENHEKIIKDYDIENEENNLLKNNIDNISNDENNDSKISNVDRDDIESFNINVLRKKLKETEKNLNDKKEEINILKKEIEDKDNKIKKISKLNNKLQFSLNDFSKQIDENLNNKDIYKNRKKPQFNLKSLFNNDELSKKELDNAMNIIKILQKDNNRLQSNIDNYEKINKLKDLENINKIKSDENSDLEKQIKILKKELKNYNLCLKKCKLYEKQINILNTENKSLKDNIKLLNNQLSKKAINEEEKEKQKLNYKTPPKNKSFLIKLDNSPISDRHKNNYNSIFYNYNNKTNTSLKLNQITTQNKFSSLPKINLKHKINFKSLSGININNINQKNNENTDEILKIYFNEEEIKILKTIFEKNLEDLESFKKKIHIIHKSKESLNSKYNLEIKKYNERILSAQEQIEYLNNKIRESEVNYRVLQTQINEFNIQKKLFQKKIKMLENDLLQKDNILKMNFGDYKLSEKKETNKKKDTNTNTNNRYADDSGVSNIINDESNNVESNKDKNSENDNESNESSFMKDDE